jgi:uncharacterized membrane protein YidH (DUF202 family)
MRTLMIIGVVLILFGILALCFQTVTFFTTERVVDSSIFRLDVQKPHTIVLHPIVGVIPVVAGLALVVLGRKPAAT